FYISGSADSVTPWMCDDEVYLQGACLGQCYANSSEAPWELCRPIEQLHQVVPPIDVTNLIPNGTTSLTFRLADIDRQIIGNSAIYLVRRKVVTDRKSTRLNS